MKLKLLLWALLLLCRAPLLLGQSNEIERNYRNALNLYEDGNVDSTLLLVEACLRSKQFYDAEKIVRADLLWLGMQSSILLKKNEQAKWYLRRMLALRPHYQVSERDLEDVGNMLGSLVVKPRLSIEPEVGLMNSWAHIFQRYFVFVQENGEPLYKEYLTKPLTLTPQFGLNMRWRLSKHLSLGIGGGQVTRRFDYSYQLIQSTVTFVEDTDDSDGNGDREEIIRFESYSFDQSYRHKNTASLLETQLSLRGHLDFNRTIGIYGEVGGYTNFLLNASKKVQIREIDDFLIFDFGSSQELFNSQETVQEEFATDISALFVKGHWGIQAGAGVSLSIKKRINLNLGFKYAHGVSSLLKEDARYTYEDLTYSLYDVFDNFSLRSFGLYGSWEVPISYKAFNKHRVKEK